MIGERGSETGSEGGEDGFKGGDRVKIPAVEGLPLQ